MNATDISKLLSDLADKLTGPAQHLYSLAVRQAVIDGAIWAVASFLVLLTGVAVLGICLWLHRRDVRGYEADRTSSAYNYGKPDPTGYIIFGGMAELFVAFTFFITFGEALKYLLNPEWQAIQNLAGLVVK